MAAWVLWGSGGGTPQTRGHLTPKTCEQLCGCLVSRSWLDLPEGWLILKLSFLLLCPLFFTLFGCSLCCVSPTRTPSLFYP